VAIVKLNLLCAIAAVSLTCIFSITPSFIDKSIAAPFRFITLSPAVCSAAVDAPLALTIPSSLLDIIVTLE
jgi:hypothetical protein